MPVNLVQPLLHLYHEHLTEFLVSVPLLLSLLSMRPADPACAGVPRNQCFSSLPTEPMHLQVYNCQLPFSHHHHRSGLLALQP